MSVPRWGPVRRPSDRRPGQMSPQHFHTCLVQREHLQWKVLLLQGLHRPHQHQDSPGHPAAHWGPAAGRLTWGQSTLRNTWRLEVHNLSSYSPGASSLNVCVPICRCSVSIQTLTSPTRPTWPMRHSAQLSTSNQRTAEVVLGRPGRPAYRD